MDTLRPTELTQSEMRSILAARIESAHGLSVDAYYSARRRGTLTLKPADDAIDVFAGLPKGLPTYCGSYPPIT